MIQTNQGNILILTIPRTGRHFIEHFLFESVGRMVPVSAQQWLDGKNPISYTPDFCLIAEHFSEHTTTLVQQLLSADPNLKIIVPMRDLAKARASAKAMNHRQFEPSLLEYNKTINNLNFHPFSIDDGKPMIGKLTALLNYCGIATHNSKGKYAAMKSYNGGGEQR